LTLGETIKQIRIRVGMTTTEFGRFIGVGHSSVSRYEEDKMRPGYLVLHNILKLADGSEKNPIIEALEEDLSSNPQLRPPPREVAGFQEVTPETGGWKVVEEPYRPRAAADAEEQLGPSLLVTAHIQRPNLRRLAEIVNQLIAERREVDSSLPEMLELWLKHAKDADAWIRTVFADALNFIRVSLVARGRQQTGKGSKARK
jgi:transcriptional regulator with XRE-family HTH domain